MREVLFRGKESKWVYGSLIQTGQFCCILENEDSDRYDYPYLDADLGTIDGDAIPIDPLTVGEFTGLFDKNGRKIFEGDIIVYNDNYKYRVYWSESEHAFYVDGINHTDLDRLGNLYGKYSEIVGNIYDNPDLLKGE